MGLNLPNDATIRVGITPGLVAGASSFTFDGTLGKPDYRYYIPIFFEYGGRSPMIQDVDYSWDTITGLFNLIQGVGPFDTFQNLQYYTVQFQSYSPIIVSPSAIIDWTFFIRKINIPNIDPSKNGSAPTLDKLNSFIAKYEPECLRNILGYALYKALLNESSQRINDLLYGVEYTDDDGVLQYWRGLVYQPKISLIANYIYVKFQEASATLTTGVSTAVAKTTAAISTSPGDKLVETWNFFSTEVQEMSSFLWNMNEQNPSIYPEFTNSQLYKTMSFSRSNNIFGI